MNILRNLRHKATLLATAGTLVALSATAVNAQVSVDENLPTYEATSGVSGSIKSVGSDTLNNLMTLWAEEFKSLYPQAAVEIEGKGSSTAPPALISGTAQLGPMSRAMKAGEEEEFKNEFGYAPTEIRTAVDALAVFVHKDNPIQNLTLDQIEAVFSVNGPENTTWGDLGATGEWADKPVSLYGRNSASGTYGFFKDVALGKADFKATVKEQPGSSAVVQGIASDKYGIGYSGIGYLTADVKALDIDGVAANAENSYAGEYPLSRFLYVYVNVPPNQSPTPIVKEFLKMVLSKQGQQVVLKDGYYPVTNFIAEEDLAKLGN